MIDQQEREHAPVAPAQKVTRAWRATLSPRRLMIQSFGVGLFYVVVLVYFSSRIPDFLGSDTIRIVLDTAAILGVVAIGQTFVIISGGFDISVGGVVPLGAVVYVEILNRHGLALALLITLALGVAVGVINGIIVARLRVNPLIGTLAMLSVAGGAAFIVTDGETVPLTGGAAGLWGDTAILGLQNGTVAFIVLAALATLVLRFTTYGRTVYTIGGNREAAVLAGLRVDAASMSVYALSGATAAFAGAIAASQLLAGSPTVGTDTTLTSIAAVVVGGASLAGGVGGVPGTVLGVLLLTTTAVGLGLLQVASFYQTIITGLVLLVAVLFGRIRDLLLTRSRSQVEA